MNYGAVMWCILSAWIVYGMCVCMCVWDVDVIDSLDQRLWKPGMLMLFLLLGMHSQYMTNDIFVLISHSPKNENLMSLIFSETYHGTMKWKISNARKEENMKRHQGWKLSGLHSIPN